MIKRFNYLRSLLFIVWGTLISFYYVINFSPPGQKENFVLGDILFGFLFILLCIVLGNWILKLFRLNDISVFEEALFSAGLGAGLLSLSIFILGLFNLFYPWAIVCLLLIFCLFGVANHSVFVKKLADTVKTCRPPSSWIELGIIYLIVLFAGITLINTLTPPIYRDALIHHLAIPKWYIRHHGIVDIPFAVSSYYPPFLEMLYTGALLLSSDILAQLLHFLFYLGSLLFTFTLAKKLLSRPMSLLAVLLFGSLPVVCQVSSIAYSDLGLTFFGLGGSLALLHWLQTRTQSWFYLGALMAGFAVGCKYNGFIILFSFFICVLFTLARWKVSLKSLAWKSIVFISLAFLVNAFWLCKNYHYTGNPIYPLASSFIGKNYSPDQHRPSPFEIRKLLYGETLRDQLLLPWNLSIKTKTIARHELDGVINPIFLVFLPFFFFLPKKTPEIKWIAGVSVLYFLSFWASSVVRLRYLVPIYPMLALLTAYTIATWEIKWKKLFVTITLVLAFFLNLYWVLIYTAKVNPISFLVGKESRRDFLCRHLPSYPVFEYINHNLPQDARIMFLYGGQHGNDGYYLNRDYYYDSGYLGYTAKQILATSTSAEEVRTAFVRMGITHLFINWALLHIDFSSSLPEEKLLLYKKFCQKYLYLEFKQGESYLYRLR